MERALSILERKAIFNNVGREEVRFVICAVCPSGQLGVDCFNIDRIEIFADRDRKEKLKREVKKEFPKDDIKVLITRVRRIE